MVHRSHLPSPLHLSALQPSPRRSPGPWLVRDAACMSSITSTPVRSHCRLHVAGRLDPVMSALLPAHGRLPGPSAPELPPAYRHSPTLHWLVSSFPCFFVVVGPSCTQNSGVAILYEGDHDNTVVQYYGILREIDELQNLVLYLCKS